MSDQSCSCVSKCGERRIGVAGGCVEFKPSLGEAVGKKLLQGFARGGQVAAAGGAEGSSGVALRSQVEMDGLGFIPVGGDLEDGGAAETAMGEEHFFAEGIFPGGGDDFGGDSGQFGIAMMIGAIENERDESGARGNDFVAELCERGRSRRRWRPFWGWRGRRWRR